MDQIKIGKFIAECRRKEKLTQLELAQKLNITDRAVSKWETGRSLPDTSIMLELCDILKITVNDLLSGEVVSVDNYRKITEQNLLQVIKEKEQADRRLLSLEFFIVITVSVMLFVAILVASFAPMPDWARITIIAVNIPSFVAGIACAIRIEQVAGYYQCSKCGHKYVPTYHSVLFSVHIDTTRYMRCPVCNQKSWQKKVFTPDN